MTEQELQELQSTIKHPVRVEDTNDAKLVIEDENRNAILTVTNDGDIITSNFDSSNIQASNSSSATIKGKRISQLQVRTELNGNELIPFAQDGENGAVSIDSIAAHCSLPITLADTDQAKLIITDENEQPLLTITNNGHIRTDSFDSANIVSGGGSVSGTHPVTVMDTDLADLIIADDNRQAILSVVGGHIRTANFDSANIEVSNEVDRTQPNPYDKLYGKKWYVLGDSFSEGDWSGATEPKFTEGLYKGQKMVYPFFVGNRTGMEVHNLARCGMTLTSGDNSVMSVFRTIPADADYVTIYIGINDNHQNKQIGTDESTDTSNFAGAYNTLLNWLVTNRPYTHVGVIVSPSSNDSNWNDFHTATLRAARRYGIPVLDIGGGGDDIPYFHRQTQKQGVLDSVRELRSQQFRVSDTNKHPNEHAHLLQSHLIEQFLRRI